MSGAFLALGLSLLVGGVPSDKKTAEVEYVYKQDLKRYVSIYLYGMRYFGHLDAQGNFLPDPKYPPLRANSLISAVPPNELINGLMGAKVYEYRSGALIPGHLDLAGNFVPEVGSRVIRFEDYRYSKDAPRIYNLPGTFVPKD